MSNWTIDKLAKILIYCLWTRRPQPFLIQHSLFLLPILAIGSIAVLLVTLITPPIYRFVHRNVFRKRYQPIRLEDDDADADEVAGDQDAPAEDPVYMPSRGFMSDFKAHVRTLREYGSILFVLEVLRVLALGALLGLSIYATIKAEPPSHIEQSALGHDDDLEIMKKWGKKKHHKHKNKHKYQPGWDYYSHLEWEEFGVSGFYVSLVSTIRAKESWLTSHRPTASYSPLSFSRYAPQLLSDDTSLPISTRSFC